MKKQLSQFFLWLYKILTGNKPISLSIISDGTPNGTHILLNKLKIGRVQHCGIVGSYGEFVKVNIILHADKIDVVGYEKDKKVRLRNEMVPFTPSFHRYECIDYLTNEKIPIKYFSWRVDVDNDAIVDMELKNEKS